MKEVENSIVLKSQKSTFDAWIVISTFILVAFGLLAIYDASVVTAFRDFGDKLYFFKNQLVWATLGFLALAFFSLFDYRRLIKLGPTLIAVSIILLLLVLVPFIGTERLGARRWIDIASFTFQPSEFVKLAVILYSASILAKFEGYKMKIFDVAIVYFLPVFIISALVAIEPDLGTALIFLAVSAVAYFIGNGPITHFFISIPFAVGGAILAIVSEPYRLERIKSFLDPNHDPLGSSYHISQIIIAIQSGGFFGVGLGSARSKFEFIPEVQNDAIFAVIVEELGFIGAIFLIALFLFLVSRIIKIAVECQSLEGKILASGVAGLIAIQALFNLAANVALVPLTGIPLPLISYGGSSLLVTLAAIGIAQNIKRQK